MKLPPVNTESLGRAARVARLGSARGRFLDSLIDEKAVLHVLKTDTKVDVGSWLFKRRVWICLLEMEILLFATGRRPYLERIPLAQLQRSTYNHVTGEVVLSPFESAQVQGLKVMPLCGLQILAHIHRGDKEHELT